MGGRERLQGGVITTQYLAHLGLSITQFVNYNGQAPPPLCIYPLSP